MEKIMAKLGKITALKIRKVDLDRRWVCYVVRSGYHNGAHCTPRDPHGATWNCGYRNEFNVSMTDEQMENWA